MPQKKFSESTAECILKVALSSQGLFVRKLNCAGAPVKGLPDLYLAADNCETYVELKVEGGKLMPWQSAAITRLKERGFNTFVYWYPHHIKDEHGKLLATIDSVYDLWNALKLLSVSGTKTADDRKLAKLLLESVVLNFKIRMIQFMLCRYFRIFI